MTNRTEYTTTDQMLADELDVTKDEIGTACFMLGIAAWVYSDDEAARIRDWVNGNGGQTIGGGVY